MDEFQESSVTGGEAPTADVSMESSAPASSSASDIGSETSVVAEAPPTVETEPTELTGQPADDLIIPESDEDLEGLDNVPHVKAVRQLRERLRAVNSQHKEALTPLNQLTEKYGSVDDVQGYLGLVDGLWSQTEDGKYTTAPFIEGIRERSPQTAWQLAQDLLMGELPLADGTNVNVWEHALRQVGLKPEQMDDYLALANGTYATPSAVSAEVLADIDPSRHDAFKALDPVIHEHWHEYTEAEQQVLLDKQQRELDLDAKEREREQFYENAKAEKLQQAQQQLVQAKEQAISTVRTEAYSYIKNELRQQWTPSGDPKQSAGAYASVMGTCAALIEPAFRGLIADELAEAGVQIDYPTLDAALERLQTASDRAEEYKASRDTERARRASVEVNNAKRQITTLLGSVATTLAGVRGGVMQERRETTNSALATAQSVRPAVNGQATVGELGSRGPKSMSYEDRMAYYRDLAARGSRVA